uniref:Large T antigen n=1 Tax=Bank vole polyomavirus TaxID=1737522 RepID=A0A0N7IN26_9POLY|nr:large T antigen [Bank vole polyomavirus]
MDRTLSRSEAKELMQLLDLDMCCWGNLPLMRKAYLNKCKEHHPDKGGNEELMKRLNSLYLQLEESVKRMQCLNEEDSMWSTTQVPTHGTQEWEEWWENFNRAWEEEQIRRDREEYSKKRKSDTSQPTASTSQNDSGYYHSQEQPDLTCHEEFEYCLNEFVSQAVFSNRTLTSFIVHTTKEKSELLYKKLLVKFKCNFASRHFNSDSGFVFLITPFKHRVSAVNNFCKTHCTVSFLTCKGVNNPYLCYSCMCRDPFRLVEESIIGGLKENDFKPADIYGDEKDELNWKIIADYAQAIHCEDPYLLMGMYSQFSANPEDCNHCKEAKVQEHYKYHEIHHHNAALFVFAKSQKSICQQACDTVTAARRVEIEHKTREELLLIRFRNKFIELNEALQGETAIEMYMAGVAWYMCLFSDIDLKVYSFVETVTRNIPKKRYWCFKGPINSGKTTLAAALLDLLGGKSLNINVPADKLPFELGVAIDQYMVVFEDVKGQLSDNKLLPGGQGMNNLDNLRDHMDGSVKVNLEKKHINKRSQIFPPGIVTMNEYQVPPTIQTRFSKTIIFSQKPHLRKCLEAAPELVINRVLHKGITLLLLLIFNRPTCEFHPDIQSQVVYWKETIDKYVGLSDFALMQGKIMDGKSPFLDDSSDTEDNA